MTKKIRACVCTKCQWGYPIFMRPDYTLQIFRCPGCGSEISFKDWLIGSDKDESR